MPESKSSFTLLVNTCDKFEDCWDPFFRLMAIHWPQYQGRVHLNTESKEYRFEGLDIESVRCVARTGITRRLTWSECLIAALDSIDDPIVLYMQEDYFLKDRVDHERIDELARLMAGRDDIHCIHLTDQALVPGGPSPFPHLLEVPRKQRYRISCQAALWKKDVLRSYLRAYESAWNFEEFGSLRSARSPHNFYMVDSELAKLDVHEILPYVFTGIVQGRWYEPVVPLFQKHGIEMDYSRRGFLKDAPRRPPGLKIRTFLAKLPAMVRSYLEIATMRTP